MQMKFIVDAQLPYVLNEFLKEEINNDLAISIGKEIISALPKKPKKGNSYTFRIEIE